MNFSRIHHRNANNTGFAGRIQTRCLRLLSGAMIFGLLGCATPIERGAEPNHYLENPSSFRLVEVLSGKSNEERMAILASALSKAKIAHKLDPFVVDGKAGTNVIADLGSNVPTLLIATHYDRTIGSPGANDNASCVASALAAYNMLRASDAPASIKVRFLFPDKEEIGLIGTKGYIRNHGVENIVGAISFDGCGIGDAYGIWDVRENLSDSVVVKALKKAGNIQGVYHAMHGPVPRYSSDHHEFFLNGVPSVGVTVLPKSDESILREYIANPNAFKWIRKSNRPVLFQTYHSPEDLPTTVEPKALDMTSRIMVETVKQFDLLYIEKKQ